MSEKTADNIDRRARDLYNKGLAAFERNNLDYAIEMFMQTLAIEPDFLQCRKILRAAQLKRAESVGKLKQMMAAARVTPLLGKAKMAAGKSPLEAIAIAEQALCEDPKNGQAMFILAEAAENAQMHETAAQTLETYTKINPKDTKALHWLAKAYTHLGNYDQAREVYERLVQMNPKDFDAQKGLQDSTAKGAMAGGGWEEAQSYRDVIKDKQEAVALEQQSRMVRAEDMVQNLIDETLAKAEQDPNNPLYRRELGKLYAQKEDYDTALRYLEELFASEAGADPTLEKEISDIKRKRITTQIAKRKAQLAANPGDAALQKEIETLELEFSQHQLADAERLVEKYPNDLMYRFDLGVLYMKTGNIDGAIEQLQRSRGQPQRRVASLHYLGQCYQKVGLTDMAIDTFNEAIAELPTMDGLKKELLYNLGSAYEELGDQEKAINAFKEIAKVDFGFRDVRQKIMRKSPSKESEQR
jgi:tetratricopeptide (TPR) repeat protein